MVKKSLHPTNQGSLYYQPKQCTIKGEILQIYHFICSVSFPPMGDPCQPNGFFPVFSYDAFSSFVGILTECYTPFLPLGFPSLSWSLCASLAWRLNSEGEVQYHHKYQEPFTYWHGFAYIYSIYTAYDIYIHMILYIIYMFIFVNIILMLLWYVFALFFHELRKRVTSILENHQAPGLGFHLHLERILLFTPHRGNLKYYMQVCHIYIYIIIYINNI